jgi:competence protein ComEC
VEQRLPPKPYAPLVWVLIGLVVGYAWAEVGSAAGAVGLKLALAVAALCGAVLVKPRQGLYAALAIAVAGCFYYEWAAARAQELSGSVAPHEATMTLEIRQRFALKETGGTAAGVGIIVEAPAEPELVGRKIAYFTRWGITEPCERGSRVELRGILRAVEPPAKTNPFAAKSTAASSTKAQDAGFEEYLWSQHIPYRLERARANAVVAVAPWPLHIVEASRRWVIATLERGHPYGEGLLPAMVTGAKAEMSRDQTRAFVRSGTYHLVAVSGMNLMVVAGLLWGVGRLARLPKVALGLTVVGALYFYAQVTGATPSVMRAFGMVALAVAAGLLRRQANLWPVVVLAAVGSLILEPLALWHGGWRLSFGVVAGLVLGMNAVERSAAGRWPKGWAGDALKAVAVSLVACLSVAPMTAAYWGLAQPYGFVLNTFAVFLAGWVTLLGSASVMLGWLPWVPEALNTVGGWVIWAIEWFIKAYLALPASAIEIPWWPSWAGGVGTLVILGGLYFWAQKSRPSQYEEYKP